MYPTNIYHLNEAFEAQGLELSFAELQSIYDDSLLRSVFALASEQDNMEGYIVACEKLVEAFLQQTDVPAVTASKLVDSIIEQAKLKFAGNVEVIAHRASISIEAADLIINNRAVTNIEDLIALANSIGKTISLVNFSDLQYVENTLVASDVSFASINRDRYERVMETVDIPLFDHTSRIEVTQFGPSFYNLAGEVFQLTRTFEGIGVGNAVAGISLELSAAFVDSIRGLNPEAIIATVGDSTYTAGAVINRANEEGSASILLFVPVYMDGTLYTAVQYAVDNYAGFKLAGNINMTDLDVIKQDIPETGEVDGE